MPSRLWRAAAILAPSLLLASLAAAGSATAATTGAPALNTSDYACSNGVCEASPGNVGMPLAAARTVVAPAAAQASATSELKNVATGLCLADGGKSLGVEGTSVTLESCTADSQEEWLTSDIPDVPVAAIVNDSTGSCLGLFDAQQSAPTLVACGDLYDDGWIYESDGTNADSYENIEAGGCLTAATTGVAFQGCVRGDTNQAWTTVPSS
jgi:hypothetical protein